MESLASIGKVLVLVGASLAVVGGILWGAGRLGLGPLPGNLHFGNETWGCYVPIGLSIVISLLLTLVLNLVVRRLGK